jgi:hypothetical protein
MNNGDEAKGHSRIPRDFVDKQFIMGMFFITGFFVFLGIAFWRYSVTNDLQVMNLVGTLFGGCVGTVIGFYFGQRPVEQIRRSLEDERQRTKELTDYIAARSKEMWERAERKRGDAND